MNFDVFNGDADGILSLVQLRRAEPRKAELITGRKRDIALLGRVKAGEGDHVTVLDISMRSNACLLYTSPSPRDQRGSRMPSSA